MLRDDPWNPNLTRLTRLWALYCCKILILAWNWRMLSLFNYSYTLTLNNFSHFHVYPHINNFLHFYSHLSLQQVNDDNTLLSSFHVHSHLFIHIFFLTGYTNPTRNLNDYKWVNSKPTRLINGLSWPDPNSTRTRLNLTQPDPLTVLTETFIIIMISC